MNNQQTFYTTGLAPHVAPHIVGGSRSVTANNAAFGAPYGQVEAIEAGPWHVDIATPESQTQPQLVTRIITMQKQLAEYVESLTLPWADYQEKTVSRCIDLMELELGYCIPSTVQLLEEVHGLNLEANDGPVVGQYAEFALQPEGYHMQ